MKKLIPPVMGALIMFGALVPVAHAATISLLPSNPAVSPGDTLDLTVQGSDFTSTTDGGSFTAAWDPSVLLLTGVSIFDPPWDLPFVSDADPTDGILDTVSVVTFGAPVGPNFSIAVLSFDVVGAGTTNVTLADDPLFGGWSAPGAIPITVSYVDAVVTSTPVPLPATVWLFGSALIGLVGVARRKAA